MQEQDALIRTIKMEDAIIGMRKDGIVHVYFRPCTLIDVPLQLKMLEAYNTITKGKKSLFIFEAGEFVKITKEARDNAVVMEEITPTLASAVMVKNLSQMIIATFYYKIKRPKQPYKVVSKFDKGIDWLKEVGESVHQN